MDARRSEEWCQRYYEARSWAGHHWFASFYADSDWDDFRAAWRSWDGSYD